MDIKKMEDALACFIELMNANKLDEIDLEDDGTKIRIRKNSEPPSVPSLPFVATMETPGVPVQALTGEVKSPTDEPQSNLVEIPSPLVGTFYRSPTPDTPSFVEEGDEVGSDTVLCIVEAMKVMNEIKSEVEGTIVEVLVENGLPVEYGQALFLIEPSNP